MVPGESGSRRSASPSRGPIITRRLIATSTVDGLITQLARLAHAAAACRQAGKQGKLEKRFAWPKSSLILTLQGGRHTPCAVHGDGTRSVPTETGEFRVDRLADAVDFGLYPD